MNIFGLLFTSKRRKKWKKKNFEKKNNNNDNNIRESSTEQDDNHRDHNVIYKEIRINTNDECSFRRFQWEFLFCFFFSIFFFGLL